ncbi:MAG: hypothetical protein D6805_01895 [Planctomycetota bacterium]|nr:MAG: hypothetical protein D6805_01895 [Planctomycetota bacterium]
MEIQSTSRILRIALFVLLSFLSFKPIRDDTLLHIKIGEYLVQHLQAPPPQYYTYLKPDIPWEPHLWGSQILFYLLYKLGGFPLLRLLLPLATFLLLCSTYYFAKSLKLPETQQILISLCVFLLYVDRLRYRPHIFSAILLYFLLGYFLFYANQLRRRQIALLSTMTILWINLHSAAVFFPALLWAYTFGRYLQGKNYTTYLLLSLCLTLCLCITPRPFSILVYILRPKTTLAYIGEYKSLWEYAIDAWNQSPDRLWVIALAIMICLLYLWKLPQNFKTHLPLYLLSLPLLYLSLRYGRFLYLLGIPLTITLAKSSLSSQKSTYFLVALLLLAAIQLKGPDAYFAWKHPSQHIDPHLYPIQAVQFIKKYQLQGRVFTDNLQWSSFAIFYLHPQCKFFTDTRFIYCGLRPILETQEIAQGGENQHQLFRLYHIQYLLVSHQFRFAPHEHKHWTLIYQDKLSRIFRRRFSL